MELCNRGGDSACWQDLLSHHVEVWKETLSFLLQRNKTNKTFFFLLCSNVTVQSEAFEAEQVGGATVDLCH